MRMLRMVALAVLALAFLPLQAQAQTQDCRQTAIYDASTNGSTKLVTGAAAPSITICGFHIVWGGTATVKLVTGTGTACATNETAITPAYSGVAQTVLPALMTPGLFAAAGLDLCIKTSAGVAVQAFLSYVQR